jgi:hypothetical protein
MFSGASIDVVNATCLEADDLPLTEATVVDARVAIFPAYVALTIDSLYLALEVTTAVSP